MVRRPQGSPAADKKGLVSCPVCGGSQVRRVPSSFGIAKSRGVTDQEKAAQLLGRSLKRYIQENFEDVGPQFAKEALKIHYGASEARNIRGVSTDEEEKMLQEEGVDFFKLGAPSPPRPKGTKTKTRPALPGAAPKRPSKILS